MDQVLTIVTAIMPFVLAVVTFLKQYVSEKWYGALPLPVGVLIAFAYSPFADEPIHVLLWAGALAGLSAGGFYSLQNVRNK